VPIARRAPARARLAWLVAAGLVATSCRDAPAPAAPPTSIRRVVAAEEAAADGVLRLGAVLATSGVLADDERPVLDALQAAITWQNARGGVHGRPVELLVADSGSSVLDGARVAAELTAAGADVLVVGCDLDVAATAARVARRAARVAVSPCAGDDAFGSDTAGSSAFSLAPLTSVVADAVAQRLLAAGLRRASTVSELVPFESSGACRHFATRFRELGGTLVTDVEIAPADAPGALGDELRRAASTAVFVSCASRGRVGDTIVAIRAARPDTPIVALVGADAPPWPGPSREGITFATTAPLWPPDASLAPLVAAGATSGPALRTFLALDVVAQASNAAGPVAGSAGLLAALRAGSFPTAVGKLRFDARQRVIGMPVAFARTTATGATAATG
jgi:ABC-type branched-subunit amino acid transport system substrate-binding protein